MSIEGHRRLVRLILNSFPFFYPLGNEHQQQPTPQQQPRPTPPSSNAMGLMNPNTSPSAFPRSTVVAPVAIGASSGGGTVGNGASGVSGSSPSAGGAQAGSVFPAVSGGGMGISTGVSSLFGADAAVIPPTSGAYGGPFPDPSGSIAMTGSIGGVSGGVSGESTRRASKLSRSPLALISPLSRLTCLRI